MFCNPFYVSPINNNTPDRPLKYTRENNQEKINILEVAKDVGIRKVAKLFKKSPATVHRWLKKEDDLKLAKVGYKDFCKTVSAMDETPIMFDNVILTMLL